MPSKTGPNKAVGGTFPYNPLKREWMEGSLRAHSEHDALKSKGIGQQTLKTEKQAQPPGVRYRHEQEREQLREEGKIISQKADGSYYTACEPGWMPPST